MNHSPLKLRGFTLTPILVLFRFLKILPLKFSDVAWGFNVVNETGGKKVHHHWCRGFTLIELMVSIVIFSVITAIVLSSNKTFGTNTKIVNASEDMVLALRQAQVYGISSKRNTDTSGNPIVCGASAFDCRLGVNFSLSSSHQFFIFVDVDDSKTYNTGDVVIETIPLATPIIISNIDCLPHVTGCAGGVLNITFKRPNPDAIVADSTTGGGYDEAHIVVSDGTKNTTIDINRTGQISVQ